MVTRILHKNENGIELKYCERCKLWSHLNQFYKDRHKKDRLFSVCKECIKVINKNAREKDPEKFKERKKKWRNNNPRYAKEYYQTNKTKILEASRRHREDNSETIKIKQRKLVLKNKDTKIEYDRVRYLKMREKKLKYVKKWQKENPEKVRIRCKKQKYRRRGLGHIELNGYQKGFDFHHINTTDGIYMPTEIHKSIFHCLRTGKGMSEINALAIQYFPHT